MADTSQQSTVSAIFHAVASSVGTAVGWVRTSGSCDEAMSRLVYDQPADAIKNES